MWWWKPFEWRWMLPYLWAGRRFSLYRWVSTGETQFARTPLWCPKHGLDGTGGPQHCKPKQYFILRPSHWPIYQLLGRVLSGVVLGLSLNTDQNNIKMRISPNHASNVGRRLCAELLWVLDIMWHSRGDSNSSHCCGLNDIKYICCVLDSYKKKEAINESTEDSLPLQ